MADEFVWNPQSRNEVYLKACCEECGCSGLPEPKTRIEQLLYQLAEELQSTTSQNGTEVNL